MKITAGNRLTGKAEKAPYSTEKLKADRKPTGTAKSRKWGKMKATRQAERNKPQAHKEPRKGTTERKYKLLLDPAQFQGKDARQEMTTATERNG